MVYILNPMWDDSPLNNWARLTVNLWFLVWRYWEGAEKPKSSKVKTKQMSVSLQTVCMEFSWLPCHCCLAAHFTLSKNALPTCCAWELCNLVSFLKAFPPLFTSSQAVFLVKLQLKTDASFWLRAVWFWLTFSFSLGPVLQVRTTSPIKWTALSTRSSFSLQLLPWGWHSRFLHSLHHR